MSGTENNVPNRKRSRKLWWSLWILVGVVAGAAAYNAEPRIYRAETMVMIVPQRVPERFVASTITAPLAERLDMIVQQILSRTRLERVIKEFNLYERERETTIMEDVIAQMRKDIRLDVDADPQRHDRAANFKVSFDSSDARTAMRVTERFGSLFVQENLEDRQLLADQTNQFLEGEIEALQRRLIDSEAHLFAVHKGRPTFSVLTAEHDVLLDTYKQLLAHSEAAKAAVSLERRQIGEQFRIIDGARLPETPISPRLFPYLALGALAGFVAGLFASLLLFIWRRRRAQAATA